MEKTILVVDDEKEIVDIMMPHMDGYTFIKTVRKENHISIIIICPHYNLDGSSERLEAYSLSSNR
jgi:CheY-like chemotaxis protein